MLLTCRTPPNLAARNVNNMHVIPNAHAAIKKEDFEKKGVCLILY